MAASPTDIAWAAGLFEGEGCIHIPLTGRQANRRCMLKIKMSDLDVLERFKRIVGTTAKLHESRSYREQGLRPQWVWGIGGREEVLAILADLEPYLGQRRREKIAEVRAMFERLDSERGRSGP